MKRSFVTPLVLCALLATGCARQESIAAPESDQPAVSAPAITPTSEPDETWNPDIRFSTVDMDGETWTDACFAESNLTLVNYWAYWCGPCVGELPDLQRISQEYASKGVRILGVSDESNEQDNIDMLRQQDVTYPCLRYTPEFDPYLDTGYIPTTIFIDSNGKVLGEAVVGSKDYDEWTQTIDGYLK